MTALLLWIVANPPWHIDAVGGRSHHQRTWGASLRAAARGGAIITCGASTGPHPSADIQRPFVRQISVHGSTMGSMEEFRRLVRSFESGAIPPQIDSVWRLDQVPQAFARLEDPDRLGKIVIAIN